jgi:hypothetical protein
MNDLRRLAAIPYWVTIELLLGVVLVCASIAGLVIYDPAQGGAALSAPMPATVLFWIMIVAGVAQIGWAIHTAGLDRAVLAVSDGQQERLDVAEPQLAGGRAKPYPLQAGFPSGSSLKFRTEGGDTVEMDIHALKPLSDTDTAKGKA